MAVSIGPKIGIDGESEYRKAMQNIIQEAKTLDAEMKALQSSFDDQNKSQEDAIREAELYNRQIEVQQEKVQQLSEWVQRSAEATGENSTETLKWKEALANAQTELNKMGGNVQENVTLMDKLKAKAAEAGPAIQKGLVSAAKAAAASLAALTAAAAGVVVEIGKSIVEMSEYGDNIDKMSQKMGISAESYQEWDYILQHSGTSIESMKTSMTKLDKAIVEGNDAFQKLGISQQQLAESSKEDIFEAVIKGLQGVQDESERTVLAQELLGKGAVELGPLLNGTADEIDEMKQAVHDLGGVMSNDAIKQSAQFQDNLQDLKTAITGLKRGFLSDLLPAVNEVMGGLIKIFSGDSDSGIKMIQTGVDKLVAQISEKLPKFLEMGTKILTSIVTAITQNLPKLLESAGEIVGQLIAGLVSMLPQLVAMAPDIVKSVVKGLINALPYIVQAGKDLIKAFLEAIKALLRSVLQIGKDIVNSVWEGIKSLNPLQWGKDLIGNFIQGIKDKFASLKSAVKDVANTVKKMLGFSEPEEGPLRDFHTYAPDMMKLYAEGIKKNMYLVENAARQAAKGASLAMTATAGTSNAYNFGGFNFVINQQPGESSDALVDKIMDKIQFEINSKKAVFA